jgi:two-component system sensor histidine kinase/response regulator
MEKLAAIDLPEALKRSMGDAGFLRNMLNELRDSIPDALARLAKAHRNRDMLALSKEAHQLKGTASNLGAKAIAAAALKLEQIGKSGNPDGCGQVMMELQLAVERFKQYLDQVDWKAVRKG